jgi:hypothetical protein
MAQIWKVNSTVSTKINRGSKMFKLMVIFSRSNKQYAHPHLKTIEYLCNVDIFSQFPKGSKTIEVFSCLSSASHAGHLDFWFSSDDLLFQT